MMRRWAKGKKPEELIEMMSDMMPEMFKDMKPDDMMRVMASMMPKMMESFLTKMTADQRTAMLSMCRRTLDEFEREHA